MKRIVSDGKDGHGSKARKSVAPHKQDAVALGKCAEKGLHGETETEALKRYESLRLQKVRQMVQSGHFYSQTFGRP